MDIYMVGGAVRDMLLGRAVRERDFLYIGSDEEFLSLYPTAHKVGKSFPIMILNSMEYAPPRGKNLADDLFHRDLTINALALSRDGVLHCHPRAMDDLRQGILRPAGDGTFTEDPLRVFRAARFAAVFPEFSIAPELERAMRVAAQSGLLDDLIPERVGAELLKALAAPAPGRFLELLARAGCLSPWFQEFEGADAIPAGPPRFHSRTVLGHIITVMNRLAGDPFIAYMGLVHDLGKTITPPDVLPHHYGHERVGEELARGLGERLRLPGRYIKAGALGASLHMTAGRYPQLRPGTRVDLLGTLHSKHLFSQMFDLVAADVNEGPGNADYREEASADLAALLAVELPPGQRQKGKDSGRILRELRCRALADARKSRLQAEALATSGNAAAPKVKERGRGG